MYTYEFEGYWKDVGTLDSLWDANMDLINPKVPMQLDDSNFRIFMKTRCCTECRIFNWDHLMMFTPFLFVDGFYARSLLTMSVFVFLLWEYCIMAYPERFWEVTNVALRCTECTDKLCTQYCPKKKK